MATKSKAQTLLEELKDEKTKNNDSTTPPKDNENELLKAQIEAMKAEMAKLTEMIQTQSSVKEQPVVQKDRDIPFINLTPSELILKGTSIWKISGQFNTRYFMEHEARVILSNMPNLMRTGAVYIADADFVRENNLDSVYRNLLNDKQLKELLSKKPEFVMEAYKNTSETQQEIIIDMISNKKFKGEKVDNNILVELGELSGKDLLGLEPMDE